MREGGVPGAPRLPPQCRTEEKGPQKRKDHYATKLRAPHHMVFSAQMFCNVFLECEYFSRHFGTTSHVFERVWVRADVFGCIRRRSNVFKHTRTRADVFQIVSVLVCFRFFLRVDEFLSWNTTLMRKERSKERIATRQQCLPALFFRLDSPRPKTKSFATSFFCFCPGM